jgi:hypothetical protein
MKYIKLIALKVNDFSSVIFFENNYRLNDKEILEVDKKCCENDGCVCVVLHMNSNIQL